MVRPFWTRLAVSLAGMPLLVSGCGAIGIPAAPVPTSAEAVSVAASATTESSTVSPTSIATPISMTPTLQPITVTAVKGNVFIRRGPDLAFDPVSVLMDGQTARALARDVLAKWVQIQIPGQAGRTGWISIQTRFIELDGNVMKLPEIMPTDWPVLASLRNCTQHDMEADPGGISIPAVASFPDNDVQINPGIYTIHDTNVDGSPQVMKVEIREGSEIDIRIDGDGNHRKCPLP